MKELPPPYFIVKVPVEIYQGLASALRRDKHDQCFAGDLIIMGSYAFVYEGYHGPGITIECQCSSTKSENAGAESQA